MPCDDSSTDDECRCGPGEVCGSCFESALATGRAVIRFVEQDETRHPPQSAHHKCTCGHLKHVHSESAGSCNDRPCACQGFTCDHSRCGWKPREEEPKLRCLCGDPIERWTGPGDPGWIHSPGSDTPCLNAIPWTPDEPPMTPEEEEEAPKDEGRPFRAYCRRCDGVHEPHKGCPNDLPPPEGPEYTPCVCDHIEPDHYPDEGSCRTCDCLRYRTKPDFELPPQPDRRPPYVVAYSVKGHLYEVALPGDATVRAVDGALVIQHHLGPVAGITQVLPVINEESA